MDGVVLHANWSEGALHVWGESLRALAGLSAAEGEAARPEPEGLEPAAHPFAASVDELRAAVGRFWALGGTGAERESGSAARLGLSAGRLTLALPASQGRPSASPRLAHAAGGGDESAAEARGGDDGDAGVGAGESVDADGVGSDAVGGELGAAEPRGAVGVLTGSGTRLARFEVPTLVAPAALAGAVLDALDERAGEAEGSAAVWPAASWRYFAAAGRFVRWLLVQQRLVPALVQDLSGALHGLWQPWLADEAVAQRAAALCVAMPPSARAAVDGFGHEAWPVLEDFLVRVLDARCREILERESMSETIAGRRDQPDAHVQWLAGLLSGADAVTATPPQRTDLLKRVRSWVGALDQRGSGAQWRLCLVLAEPVDTAELSDFAAPGTGLVWPVSLFLQAGDDARVMIDARDIWVLPTDGASVQGRRIDRPQELLLAELGRAARLYPLLEKTLRESEPAEVSLTTTQAYEFLREVRPALVEQGFGVRVPEWWDSPHTRLGVRLRIDSPEKLGELLAGGAGAGGEAGGPQSPAARSGLGLHTLVNYRWQVTIGQTTLSLEEFERLASLRSPLVLIGGRWVEVRPEDVKAAVEFIRANPGGQMEVGKALRLAYSAEPRDTGLPVVGMEASGWVSGLLGDTSAQQTLPIVEPPESFVGSLRPYQVKGLSWLAFLDKLGLGSCLADDMGLGKTIQLLALMLHERALAGDDGGGARGGEGAGASGGVPVVGPTLLVAPMSVVGNWMRETQRFAPRLRVLVHHGMDRLSGAELVTRANASDLVITTYALAHRDRADLEKVGWWRIALDEAQNIKNPGTKQAQAIRALDAPRRVALTGTPIENRLSELWSIMDFLNPGLLGAAGDFRRRFAVPVERFRDQHRARQLRGMVQPFVLRRLKTDPSVIADLPEKVESKEFCYLTPEQATLYETTVRRMLEAAEHSEGIQRRGVILAGLVRLKQICNHPAQFVAASEAAARRGAEAEAGSGAGAGAGAEATARGAGAVGAVGAGARGGSRVLDPHRSGKCVRILQMLEEVVAAGGQALVFTQFRQMGDLLATMLRQGLDREVLFLHGGTSAKDRDAMVAAFNRADGRTPVFILSLKAGGVGLNLTGANHVFHFDRWWNPAVENQATDRAFRIGQTRTVQVHKFVVSGTLEERIDQMIEQKSSLAENVIGSGEQWLTELSLSQLRDVLALRREAVSEEGEE